MGGSSALSMLLSKQRVEGKQATLYASQFSQASDPNAVRVEMEVSTRSIAGTPVSVYTSTPERHIDTFLQETLRQQKNIVDGLGAQVKYLGEYISVFGTKGQNNTISQKISNVVERLAEISIDPGTVNKKYDTITAIKDVTNKLNFISQEIINIRTAVDEKRTELINQANSLITDIARLGRQTADLTFRNEDRTQTENDLDAKVHELSGILDIRVSKDTSNQYTLTTSNFQILYSPAWDYKIDQGLALLNYPGSASVVPGQPMGQLLLKTDPSAALATINIENALVTGQYGALTKVDQCMVNYQQQLDELTTQFANTVNNAHCLGASKIAPSSFTGTLNQPGLAAPMTGASVLSTSGILRLGIMDNTTGQIVSYRDIDLSNPVTVGAITNAGQLITELSNGTGVTATINPAGQLQLNLTLANPNHGIVMGTVTGQNAPLVQGGGIAPPIAGPNTAQFQLFFGLNQLIVPGPQQVGSANVVSIRNDIVLNPDMFAVGCLIDTVNPMGTNAVPQGDLSVRTQILNAIKNSLITFAGAGNLPGGTKTLLEYSEELVSYQSKDFRISSENQDSEQKTYDRLAKMRKDKDGIDVKQVFTDLAILAQSRQLTTKAMKIILSLMSEVQKLMD